MPRKYPHGRVWRRNSLYRVYCTTTLYEYVKVLHIKYKTICVSAIVNKSIDQHYCI